MDQERKKEKKERKLVCFQLLKRNKDGFIMILETNPKCKETNPRCKETNPPFLLALLWY
jgi:hypothetical protein